jgi:glycosyltransferase involved in cell wall biosynthesis
MKISIVTISFNQARYLRQCIESILSQTDCDLEYIIVDPGSTDGSREIIESYGDRIVRVFEPDAGPSDGLNRGFCRATGEVFGFINSDDYLLPGALKCVSDYFSKRGEHYFVTGNGFSQMSEGIRSKIIPRPLTVKNMLHRSAVMFQQGTFFPAHAMEKAGYFNVRNTTCWDYELFLKLLLIGLNHEVIQNDLAVFRLHDDSISGSGRLKKKYFKELDRIFFEITGAQRNILDRGLGLLFRLKRKVLW